MCLSLNAWYDALAVRRHTEKEKEKKKKKNCKVKMIQTEAIEIAGFLPQIPMTHIPYIVRLLFEILINLIGWARRARDMLTMLYCVANRSLEFYIILYEFVK